MHTVSVWIPWHQPGITCWCRPHETDEHIVHRRLPIRPDREARAFVLLHRGVPA